MTESTTISVRPATEDDLDAVLAIEQRCYKFPWTRAHFIEELETKGSHFLVLTDDETDTLVAGYVVFRDRGDESHLLNVAVAHNWRGLGMGRKLVGYVVNHAYRQKQSRVFLEVRTENLGAVTLYEKLGFHRMTTRKKFYSDGADAFFMQLNLKNTSDSDCLDDGGRDGAPFH